MEMETYEEKIKDLKRYQEAIRTRQRMQEGLAEYKGTRMHPTSPGTDGAAGTGGNDMSDYFKKIEEKEEEIKVALKEEEHVRDEIIEKINRIENPRQKNIENQKDILFKIYICNKSMREISKEMKYSEDNVYKTKKQAIKNYHI